MVDLHAVIPSLKHFGLRLQQLALRLGGSVCSSLYPCPTAPQPPPALALQTASTLATKSTTRTMTLAPASITFPLSGVAVENATSLTYVIARREKPK